MSFAFRGFEMHGRRMWERRHVLAALDFIAAHDMTALVLHESDLIHNVVFPRAFFDPTAKWKKAPVRRGENALQNNRVYLDHILALAHRRGVEVWLEVKELAFPDEVLEARPGLIKNGVVCPSEPFWAEFIARKTEELVADFPRLAGIILSPGSPEGRAARSQGKCGCEVCAGLALEDWYDRIIRAMHAPLARAGKRLAVRDFAYRPADHAPLIAAVERQPDDVIFCIKVTPHDFYPTFPDNPAIAKRSRPQWVEYDTMGQFFGWGVFPCLPLGDLRARLAHARANGVSGGLFRTEWERVNDWWVLESLNVLTLAAAAAFARDPAVEETTVLHAALRTRGVAEAVLAPLADLLLETWPVLRGALYIDGFVFADCSMLPLSVGRAWWTMEQKHGLADWAPDRAGALRLDAARIDALMAEKRAAHRQAQALRARLGDLRETLPEPLRGELARGFDLLPTYTEGMMLAAGVCLRARWQEAAPKAADRAALAAAIDRLERFGAALRPLAEEAEHPHQTVMLLDHRRAAAICAEARQIAARTGS